MQDTFGAYDNVTHLRGLHLRGLLFRQSDRVNSVVRRAGPVAVY